MTDQQHLITPPHDKVYWWWEEACKRPPSSFFEKLDYVAEQAAQWGRQQRDASVPGELQEARDEELDVCCEYIQKNWFVAPQYRVAELRAARRPRPKSLAEKALEAVTAIKNMADDYKQFDQDVGIIHRALERLQELEGQDDG